MAGDLELALFDEDRRVFLGGSELFLTSLTHWLWQRREELPGILLVVPTAQSGRRLREALAELGACLAPKVVTPGFFMRVEEAAPEAVELLAWIEVLEGVQDWGKYATAFPIAPGEGEGPGWALGLARSLVGVRTSLQENSLTISAAAKRLAETVEGERWRDLAALEEKVHALLREWGMNSRNVELARGRIELPVGVEKVVVAGVADLTKAVERLLDRVSVPVSVLIAGEEREYSETYDPGELARFYRIQGPAVLEESADFRITFTSLWSETSFDAVPTGDHFSPLVGGMHNASASFWNPGTLASTGIEEMAEEGATTVLLQEVQSAISAGTAQQTLLGSGLGGAGSQTTLDFTAQRSHPLMSITSMIAPSPDWFVGLHDLSLLKSNDDWIESMTFELVTYDAGTDNGTTFMAANQDTSPAQPISLIPATDPNFAPATGAPGAPIPIARLVITRMP